MRPHRFFQVVPIAACVLLVLLAGCASIGEFMSRTSPQTQALLDQAQGQYDQHAVDQAAATLAQVDPERLDEQDTARYRALAAGIALSKGDPARAASLSADAPASLPPELRARLLDLHARALEARGDAFGAAGTLALLQPLQQPRQRAGTQKAIRRLLLSLGADPLKARYDALAESDPLKPYAEAALQSLGIVVARTLPQLDHPVGTEAGEGGAAQREGYHMPAQIALLLPTQGALAIPAAALREGFFTAYFGDTTDAPRPRVRSYDSGGAPAQAQAAYQQAVADGATLVVGPLGRDSVAAMFSQTTLPVPLLALNHPDNNLPPPPGSSEFGLLPETEGAEAAAHMDEVGLHLAVVFQAGDDRAKRAAEAFKAQFESLGGKVLNRTTLPANSVDYSEAIKAALNGVGDDAGILLLMRAQQARLLMPQLHLAGSKQKVFATSLVYTGGDNAVADQDLDGIEFCDAPWLFDAQPGLPNHAAIAAKLPDARNAAARLFAYGMDAYALMPYLDWLRTHPGAYLPGATGQLTEDAQGRVHRVPVWASFQDGIARPVAAGLESVPAPASSTSQ